MAFFPLCVLKFNTLHFIDSIGLVSSKINVLHNNCLYSYYTWVTVKIVSTTYFVYLTFSEICIPIHSKRLLKYVVFTNLTLIHV